MVIDYGVDDWRPGFGYKWGDTLPTPYFSGCSLGPYREKLGRARAAALERADRRRSPAGLPGTAFAATGADAPPKITLVGPKGERITTPDDLTPVEDQAVPADEEPAGEAHPGRDHPAERGRRGR